MLKKLLVLSIVFFFLQSCSKNDVPAVSNLPYSIAPVDGSLELNLSKLTLHVGNNTTVVAKQKDITGNVNSSASFSWSSSDNTVATVSNGIITAVGIGLCEVFASDGVHPNVSVSINVVANSVVIPNTASQISFTNDILIMQTNVNATIPAYILYNEYGGIVNTSVAFELPTTSGLSVSSNTISSSATTGSFDVTAKAGSTALTGRLRVMVVPNSSDYTYGIKFISNTIPESFYDNNVIAKTSVIKVSKAWTTNGVFNYEEYTTSPDAIELNDDCVTINNSGFLTSVHESKSSYSTMDAYADGNNAGCIATFKYKNASAKAGFTVYKNITSDWGGSAANNDSYNYCVTQTGAKIDYQYGASAYNSQELNGTYNIIKNGNQFLYGPSNTFTGAYSPSTFFNNGPSNIKIIHNGESYTIFNTNHTLNIRVPEDKMFNVTGYDEDFSLDRESGNCDSTNPGNLPVVKIVSITGIQRHSAIITYQVVSDGGSPLLDVGMTYGYDTAASNGTWFQDYSNNPSIGVYTFNLTNGPDGLISGTTYYVQAFASNQNGISHSSIATFNTLP